MKKYQLDDYVNYRLQKAKDTISEVDLYIKNEFWNTAMNRLYYSCFYAVGALLVKIGISASSHSGIRQQFGHHFVQTGKISKELARHYSELFDKRQKNDYDDFYDIDEETVMKLLEPSKLFIGKIEELINAK